MTAKHRPISGFPELPPDEQLIAQDVVRRIESYADLHGFRPLETRSVERLTDLLSKSDDLDKEMYLIHRRGSASRRDELGLHFDLTVPLARYVVEHNSAIVFPYRRSQVQRVWRGERPQDGRYREFVQADFDIVGRDSLPLAADAEVLAVVSDVMASLPLPPVEVKVNSRPYVLAILDELEVAEERRAIVLQVVDKVDRVGRAAVEAELLQAGLELAAIDRLTSRLLDPEAADVGSLNAEAEKDGALGSAARDIVEVMSLFRGMTGRSLSFAPSLVRGLDYYTGIVAESSMKGWERLGSICSGGRYDRLAELGGRRFPGVGASIGVSRLLVPMSKAKVLRVDRQTPTVVFISASRDRLGDAFQVAAVLRSRGIPTEVGPAEVERAGHLRYADRLGIPYSFLCVEDGWEVLDMNRGEREMAEPDVWLPSPAARSVSWRVEGQGAS